MYIWKKQYYSFIWLLKLSVYVWPPWMSHISAYLQILNALILKAQRNLSFLVLLNRQRVIFLWGLLANLEDLTTVSVANTMTSMSTLMKILDDSCTRILRSWRAHRHIVRSGMSHEQRLDNRGLGIAPWGTPDVIFYVPALGTVSPYIARRSHRIEYIISLAEYSLTSHRIECSKEIGPLLWMFSNSL